MQHSMARVVPRPAAGIVDDIEEEDDAEGYEAEDTVRTVEAVLVLPPAVAPPPSSREVAA